MQRLRRHWPRLLLLLALIAVGGSLRARAAPPASDTAQVYLPLIARPGAPSPPAGASSAELIGAAYRGGALSVDLALRYLALAAYRDPRLPAAYRGADSAAISLVHEEAARLDAQLGPETRAILGELSLPPSAPGSWEERQSSAASSLAAASPRWATTCATSAVIKVWYHPGNAGDAATARSICELVDGTIWPKLVGLMGRAPLDDSGVPNNGGDSRLDIYLVDAASSAVSPINAPQSTPAYLLVNRRGHTRAQLAELLMQAILMGYDADPHEYVWLRRATVAWAPDYVFPTDNAEHALAPGYLNATATPLDDLSRTSDLVVPLPGDAPSFADGAYLWPFYLARVESSAALVAQIWAGSANPDSLALIDGLIPGRFRERWPHFARLAWNRQPAVAFQAVDGLAAGARPAIDQAVRLDGAPAGHYAMPGQVNYLAAEYYHYSFPDDDVRAVLFTNSLAPDFGSGSPDAAVQALYTLADGSRHVADWTGRQYVPFCRDLAAERVTDLTIIVSNSDWRGKQPLAPFQPLALDATNVACRGWSFTATASETTASATSNLRQTTVITSSGTFELSPDAAGSTRPGYTVEVYEPRGTATWSHRGQDGDCSGSGSGSFSLSGSPSGSSLSVETYNHSIAGAADPLTRHYAAAGAAPAHERPALKVIYRCPQTQTTYMLDSIWLQTFRSDLGQTFDQSVSADGRTLQGEMSYATTGGLITTTYRYTWTMQALPPE